MKPGKDKAEVLAEHLETVFQANDFDTDREGPAIKICSPRKVRHVITKLKANKAPEHDIITAHMLKELRRKDMVLLTNMYNSILRLSYFSSELKLVKIIVLPKPTSGYKMKSPESSQEFLGISPITNAQLHNKLHHEIVKTIASHFSLAYEKRLHKHRNTETIVPLASPTIRRHKRWYPVDFA